MSQEPAAKSSSHKQGVVIVGGGPAGLSAALMLAKRGWKDITVVEQQKSVTFADPDRSYGKHSAISQ
jgi:2-polyprenyl-6-methoxyphenol hydroxylase-like FAD-dependent oxidoreductase